MNFGSVRRKRSYLAAIGGVAGASGLAAIGVVLSGPPAVGANEAARQAVPAAGSRGGDGGSKDGGSEDGDKGKDHDGDEDGTEYGEEDWARRVPCDSDLLIAALVRANAKGVGRLELEPKCTYTLTAFDDDEADQRSGLPAILGRVSIEGNGATIVRAANAEPYRIFNVGFGGNLTLRNLTVKGGDTRNELGGGALLVQEGGRATIKESNLTLNRSATGGGAISNFGVTRIVGGDTADGKHGTDDKEAEDGKHDATTEITRNSAVRDGGAILNVGSLTVDRARLSDNTSLDDGGALVNSGVAKLSRTKLDRNHSIEEGGAIAALGAAAIIELQDSSVTGNSSGDAGGIANDNGRLYLQRTEVRHNTAADDAGGVQNLVGIVTVDQSRISENSALVGQAGGFANLGGTAVLRDSEVKLNRAFGPAGLGAGILNIQGDLTLTDTRVVENASTLPPGGISTDGPISVDDDSTIIKNRPTNCAGNAVDVPNCFG
ncbi:hypothetical protein [Actinopolymorpha pittospori]|uniref:Polymorphic outer membrane protein repeat-containing protein n=1 Tax=Actinopolymorpha pittospori TaxID=648752 RepID=A0A927RQK5_9ACTN|nr:hypothetical protein [Actinopolymorpha pittospori]MBE1613186.1 hypothetical protein [Actinopolymorpha pittospori]